MALSVARANAALDEALSGATHVQLHDGAPGSAGTDNVFTDVGTTRQSATFGTASDGELAITDEPEWTMSGSGTITHLSVWTADTAGTFIASAELSPTRAVVSDDVLILRSLTFSMTTA